MRMQAKQFRSIHSQLLVGLAYVSLIFVVVGSVWWILWMGGPLSDREDHFHQRSAYWVRNAKEKPVSTEWNNLTNFSWARACKIKSYDTEKDVSDRLGVPVNKYPMRWWASTDGYHGIAFVDKYSKVTTVRIPISLINRISGSDCFVNSSSVEFQVKSTNGYEQVTLIIK